MALSGAVVLVNLQSEVVSFNLKLEVWQFFLSERAIYIVE